MRIESSVMSITWIPSEAVRGLGKAVFDMGVTHYDAPPPEVIEDLEALRLGDAFRFANELRGWVEVKDGRITGYGHAGKGHIGATTVRLAGRKAVFQGIPLPDLRREDVAEDSVRFVQTTGGRTALPAPRRVRRKPFVQVAAPTAWTTLALTIRADGSTEHEVVGASSFPRHWIYDDSKKLVGKTGLIDFKTWFQEAFGRHTPWGDEDSRTLVTEVESALERQLSADIMRSGQKPKIRKIKEGATLFEQGQTGSDMVLLLDGVLSVEVDGDVLTEVGPGAILGERALLEGGTRTSTLRAVTPGRVAVIAADQISEEAMSDLASGHRREEA